METSTVVSRNGIVVDMLDQYLADPTDMNLYQVIDSILIRLNQGAYFYTDDTGKSIFTGKKELPGESESGHHAELLSRLLESAFRSGDKEDLTVNPGIHDFLLSEDLITMIMAGRFTDAEKNHLFLRRGIPEETRCEGAAGWDLQMFEGLEGREQIAARCQKGFRNLLEAAKKRGLHSIALVSVPDLGDLLPAEEAAEVIVGTANEWISRNRDYGLSIEFCCDAAEYEAFADRIFNNEEEEEPDEEETEAPDREEAKQDGIPVIEEAPETDEEDDELPYERLQRVFNDSLNRQETGPGEQVREAQKAEPSSGIQKAIPQNTAGFPETAWEHVIRYGSSSGKYSRLVNDAPCRIQLFGETGTSVSDYLEKVRTRVFSGRKPNEFLWTKIRSQILYRGMLEKYRQNPDLLKLLLDTGIALLIREEEPEEKKRVFISRKQTEEEAFLLMKVRRELRFWKNTGKDLSFKRYSLNSSRRIWDMKLHEIAGLPDAKEMILPFACLMVYYQPGKLKSPEEFIERAPDIRALDAAMARRKGGPLPEWREMLQRLSDAEFYEMI